MNYGLYLAAGGTLGSMHRLDVIANNLANVNTVGFKPDAVLARHRLPERLEAPRLDVDPQRLLEQLGGGIASQSRAVRLAQGALEVTGNTLDVAIDGDGLLVVERPRPDGAPETLLTRDGRLTRDDEGRLALASSRLVVLGVDDRPIQLADGGDVHIDADGTVRQNGLTVGQLRLASTDESNLVKEGDNLLALRGGDASLLGDATGRIVQGSLEQSAVDPVLMLQQMISASKAIEANAQMMQYHDHILGQTVNTFGRVA